MRFCIITLCLLMVLPLSGQEVASPPAQSQLLSGLKVGARFLVTRTKERYQVQGGQKSLATKAQSLVEMEVLSIADNGSRQLLWTLKENQVEAQGNEVFRLVLDQLQALTRDKSFIFEVNPDGEISRLVNPEDVMKAYSQLTKDLGDFMTAKAVDPMLAQSILSGIEPFTKAETVQDISLRDAKLLFFRPQPMPSADKSTKRASTIENPFGGDPVPSTIWTRIEEPQPGSTWLVHEEQLDYEAAAPVMRAAIETQALMRGEQLPTDFKLPKIEATDRFAFEGFQALPPTQMIHEYIVLRDGQGRHDRDRFTVKPIAAATPTKSGDSEK